MEVIQIIDGALVIDINAQKYPKLAAEMRSLDTNGDNKVAVDDFSAKPTKIDRHRFREAVVNAFVKRKFMTEAQGQGMYKFFDMYEKIRKQKEVVDDWKIHHIDTSGENLKFNDLVYWKSKVEPEFLKGGMFYDNLMEQGFYNTLYLLSDTPEDYGGSNSVGQGCNAIYELNYNLNYVPTIIKDRIEQFISWHKSTEEFLTAYTKAQCIIGSACPGATLGKYNIFVLKTTETNKWEKVGIYCSNDNPHWTDDFLDSRHEKPGPPYWTLPGWINYEHAFGRHKSFKE